MEERLQKLIAQAGIASRRASEELITAGRVTVNGKVAELGQKADLEKDRVLVDGRPLKAVEAPVYIALNKPRGVVTTADDELGRPTVLDFIPISTRLYPVGRLDLDSEGLVLLTNDGEMANRLSHPRYEHPKEYQVLVARQPDLQQLEAFRHGVVMPDGYRTVPAEVRVEASHGKGAWLNVVLHEGRKRQIRETCAQIGLPVVRIIRVRIGSLRLGNLKPREWRHLTPAEVEALKAPNKILRRSAPKDRRITRPRRDPTSTASPSRKTPKAPRR